MIQNILTFLPIAAFVIVPGVLAWYFGDKADREKMKWRKNRP